MRRKYVVESTAKDLLRDGYTDIYGRIPSLNPKQKYLVIKVNRIGRSFITFPGDVKCPKSTLQIEYFYYAESNDR